MRITILKDDNMVTVDGVPQLVDCTGLPADFHALQWDGTTGEIEYSMTVCAHCGGRSKKMNGTVFSFTPYQPYVDAWGVAKTTAEAAREAALQAQADVQAQLEAAHASRSEG